MKPKIHDDGCRDEPELALLRLWYYCPEFTFEGRRISIIRYSHHKYILVIDFHGGARKTRSCREHIWWLEGFNSIFCRISDRGSCQHGLTISHQCLYLIFDTSRLGLLPALQVCIGKYKIKIEWNEMKLTLGHLHLALK
jgi:hypothetical protein